MIIIDSREPPKIAKLLERDGFNIKIKQLPYFDYVVGSYVNGKVVMIPIERKEIHDYIESIIDGRLNNQLFNMSKLADFSYLCVIGIVNEVLIERKIKRSAYIGSLISASLKHSPIGKGGQIVTVNLESDYDFVLFLELLHKKIEKGDFERMLRPRTVNKSTKKEVLTAMYSCLPMIGYEKAKKLAEKFTLKELLNASIEDLSKVEGIGKKTAQKIYEFVHSL